MSYSLKKTDTETVIFQRLTFEGDEDCNVAKCDQVILSTRIHLDGIIGDIEGQVEVDFANENVGFGQTGTQVKITSIIHRPGLPFDLYEIVCQKYNVSAIYWWW
jgi:hypothetical protein